MRRRSLGAAMLPMAGLNQPGVEAADGLLPCVGCPSHLPLRPVVEGERGFRWECCGCGAQVVGVMIETDDEAAKARVRLVGLQVDGNRLPQPADGVQDVARQYEQGGMARRSVAIAVTALALNADMHPVGEPFRMMTRDISKSGIGLLHDKEISAPYLAIQLPGLKNGLVQIVAKVVRCHPMGSVYDVGAQFIGRTDR